MTTACMLLLPRGYSRASVQNDITASALSALSPRQTPAVDQLMSTLDSRAASPPR